MSTIERLAEDAYKQGWLEAAKWAERDDLVCDTGSHAYSVAMCDRIDATTAQAHAEYAELERRNAAIQSQCDRLEILLERLLEYCNNIGEGVSEDAIAAGAELKRLYRARKAALAHSAQESSNEQ